MTLDRDLSNQAKAYAQKIANMGQLMHSSQAERGQSVGENLAYACASNGTPLTGESATKMWYVSRHFYSILRIRALITLEKPHTLIGCDKYWEIKTKKLINLTFAPKKKCHNSSLKQQSRCVVIIRQSIALRGKKQRILKLEHV